MSNNVFDNITSSLPTAATYIHTTSRTVYRSSITVSMGNTDMGTGTSSLTGSVDVKKTSVSISKTVIKESTISGKPNMIINCVYCKGNHKFSPFNVNSDIRLDLKQPIMVYNMSCKSYRIKIYDKSNAESYVPITIENMSNDNILNDLSAVFWGNGLSMFNNDNGLLLMMAKNIANVDQTTVINLVSYINCPNWWDKLYSQIANHHIPIINKDKDCDMATTLQNKIEEIHKQLLETVKKIGKFDKTFDEYEFTYFEKSLKRIGEIIKRANEDRLRYEAETEKVRVETEKREKQERELEKFKKAEQEQIDNFKIEKSFSMSFDKRFKEKLRINRKIRDFHFIAAINPDSNVIADMINKLGEVSKLQSGVDIEDKLRKIKVYEYFLKQKAEMEKGIKLKKINGWKKSQNQIQTDIPEIPTDPKILLELTNVQQIQYKKLYDTQQLNKKSGSESGKSSGPGFVLDQWQSDAINTIRKSQSCLITGPTSGGKTYVMMKALDNIINNGGTNIIVYVSPTFHLAYQTYANIKATFPNRKVAIVTIELVHIPNDANIFIGTACELLNYFITSNTKFHVGIIDEIHVSATPYFNTNSTKDNVRACAYGKLISRCLEQVVAASATINNEIAMITFMAEMFNLNREKKIAIEDIKLIKYTERAVPLMEYRYNDMNSSLDKIDRTIQNISQNQLNMSSENLFKLLIKMKDHDMIPAIVFDNTDDVAWKTYVDLINYCSIKESIDYKSYGQILDNINNMISSYNDICDKVFNSMPENDNCDSSRMRIDRRTGAGDQKNNGSKNKRDFGLRTLCSKRLDIVTKMISDTKISLSKNITQYNENPLNETLISNIAYSDISKNIMAKICKLFEVNPDKLLLKYPKFSINWSHIDTFELITTLSEIDVDIPDKLLSFEVNKGSFYRFSKTSCGMDMLKAIREPGSDQENWKQRTRMITLAQAQNIQPKDIDGIIDVIMRGLEFGISIINPSLPFAIQNIILEHLKSKDMGVVFASESMSMGINYPLRSVIIKSNSDKALKLIPGKMIQMSGRCGRRGLDNQAHVIFWGIENDLESHSDYIEAISYPEHFIVDHTQTKSGCIISDHEKIAIKLGEIHMTSYFDKEKEMIKKQKTRASDMKNGGRVKDNNHNTKTDKSEKNDIYDDMERRACEKRAENINIKRELFLNPVVKCLCSEIGFDEERSQELSDMICKIDEDIIMESYLINSFERSQNINLLMNMIIEIHNFYAMSNYTDFLQFLERIANILQTCEYKLIKLGK